MGNLIGRESTKATALVPLFPCQQMSLAARKSSWEDAETSLVPVHRAAAGSGVRTGKTPGRPWGRNAGAQGRSQILAGRAS